MSAKLYTVFTDKQFEKLQARLARCGTPLRLRKHQERVFDQELLTVSLVLEGEQVTFQMTWREAEALVLGFEIAQRKVYLACPVCSCTDIEEEAWVHPNDTKVLPKTAGPYRGYCSYCCNGIQAPKMTFDCNPRKQMLRRQKKKQAESQA